MKTFARAKAVAANAVKKVQEIVSRPDHPMPDYEGMEYKDLKMCAKAEGLSIYHKTSAELIEDLTAVFFEDSPE